MITCSQFNVHSVKQINPEKTDIGPVWQQAMKTAIRSPDKLLEILELPGSLLQGAKEASKQFQVFVPLSFIENMEKGNVNDPLLRQVLPVSGEMDVIAGYISDPLGEQSANPVRGVLHKYSGRLLLFPGTTCAINCRYCFRRHFPYHENRLNREEWKNALTYIENSEDITEVIFSGGDPLAINDQRLAWLVKKIEEISHVKRLRIHTRLPVVIPERVDNKLLGWLRNTRLQIVMVMHCNHPNEISDRVSHAFGRLKRIGTTLLNQSVLLRGVNDCTDTLKNLSERLFESGVLPYYLHLPDKVQGTAHFDIDEKKARLLAGKLSQQCPGYLVPRLVREEKGKLAKTILSPLYE